MNSSNAADPKIQCFYRLAPRPAAEPKAKLPAATKEACLSNFLSAFPGQTVTIIGDCLNEQLRNDVLSRGVTLKEVSQGSGGGAFREAAALAMELPDETAIYLVEDDFLHHRNALPALLDGLSFGAEYVTLYDHPDKYLDPKNGGNPHVREGGEATRLLCGNYCHWKLTNSTVMTFATTVGQLRKDWRIILRFCGGRYTDDYRLFRKLTRKGRRLISSVPGFATHSETRWLAPFVDWESVAHGR